MTTTTSHFHLVTDKSGKATDAERCEIDHDALAALPHAEPRQYVLRYEDESLRVVTAEQLGSDLAHAYYSGDNDAPDVWTFLGAEFVKVELRSSSGGYDSDEYADVAVELVVRDTVLGRTGYRIDGRA